MLKSISSDQVEDLVTISSENQVLDAILLSAVVVHVGLDRFAASEMGLPF